MNKKIIKIVLLLLVVVLNSSILFTYSMFRSSKTGNGTINGATWSVSSVGNKNSITLIGGGSEETYTITVQNNSEVDLNYSILLTNIPNGVQVKLDNGNFITVSNNQITFSNVGTLLYGAVSRNHTLTFKTSINSTEVSSQSVNVNVEFVQKLN